MAPTTPDSQSRSLDIFNTRPGIALDLLDCGPDTTQQPELTSSAWPPTRLDLDRGPRPLPPRRPSTPAFIAAAHGSGSGTCWRPAGSGNSGGAIGTPNHRPLTHHTLQSARVSGLDVDHDQRHRCPLVSAASRITSTPSSASSLPVARARCSAPRSHRTGTTSAFASVPAPPNKPEPASTSTSVMPGRPGSGGAANPKRSAADGAGDDEPSAPGSGGKMKLPRLDRGAEDFSSVVKNRLQSYTRTGQACDRCKVRKIRCDGLPEGCSHCINLGLECFVTDRVTGRTERRGYMQQLEREKNGMLDRIRDLEKLLGDRGVEVKPWISAAQSNHPPGVSFDTAGNPISLPGSSADEGTWAQFGSLWVKDHSPDQEAAPTTDKTYLIPNFPRSKLESRPEDTNLGVGWDSRPLSSISGTKLTIMGTTIDTASFEAPDMDEPPAEASGAVPLYNKSVQAFLQSAMGANPPVRVDLPSRDDAFTYAQWYFLIMSSYIPVIHRPTFMKLLERVYDEPDFVPSAAELVQVHMVFAIIYYQYGVRNWQEIERRNQLNDLSNKHYHFSLRKFFDLMASRDLSAVQAMVLIASHTRAFPKPGCGALISNLAFQRALELNLHRAPKIPEGGTNLDIEMRKRTWWVLMSVYVAVTGRRGRPMPITVEEFDVDFPEPINDELLTADGIDTSRQLPCDWEVGMATFKIVPILMEMYSSIYSVRRDTQNYIKVVYALEKQLQQWENDLPQSLRLDCQDQQNNLAALYTRMFGLELRLWLRHNSVNPTSDKKMMAENTRVCEETARELLRVVQQVIALKSLDTTWTQMAVYAMSLFSMLVAHWERRFETTPEKVAVLRREMDEWMDVLRELSQLICSGPEIQNEIGRIVDRTIAWIEHDMRQHGPKSTPPVAAPAVRLKKEHSATEMPIGQVPPQPSQQTPVTAMAPHHQQQQQQQHQQHQQHQHHHHHHQQPHHQPHHQPHQPHQQPPPPPPQPTEGQQERGYFQDSNMNGHATYPTLTYGDHTHGSHLATQPYDAEAAMFYSNPAQQAAAAAAAAAVATGGEPHPNPLIAFASQATQHVDPTGQLFWQRGAGNTWQDWTAAIAHSQDRLGAGALLAMGTPAATTGTPRGSVASLAEGDSAPHEMAAQWPLVMFDQHPSQQQHQLPHSHHHHEHPHQHHGATGA